MEPETVGQRIVDSARVLCETAVAALYRLDRDAARLTLQALSGGPASSPFAELAARPAGASLAELAARSAVPVVTADLFTDPRIALPPDWRDRAQRSPHRAALCVALRVDTETLGVLVVGDSAGRVFDRDLVRALQAFVDPAALALEQSWRRHEDRQQLRRAETMLAVTRALNAAPHPTEIFRRTLREVVRSLGADVGRAWLLEPGVGRFVSSAGCHVTASPVETWPRADLGLDDPLIEEMRRRGAAICSSIDETEQGLEQVLGRLVPHKSIIVQPAWSQGELIAVLAVAWLSDTHRVSADELRLMEALAERVAGSLEAAALHPGHERTRRPVPESGPAPLPTSPSGQGVFDTIATAAVTLLEASMAVVWVADPRDRVLWPEGRCAMDPALEPVTAGLAAVPYGEGVVGETFASRVPRFVPDSGDELAGSDPPSPPDPRAPARAEIPLIAGDAVLGVLSIWFGERRRLAPEERDTLDVLATHAALAIENARSFAETDQRRRAAESLAGVGRWISQSLDPEDVGRRIVDSVRLLVGALRATLIECEPDSKSLRLLAVSGEEAFPLGPGVAGFAIRERRPLITADLLSDPRIMLAPDVRAHLERLPVRAVLSVPLVVGDLVIGALSVGDRPGRIFDDEEVLLLQAFADQAAIAIHNAHLYAETRRQQQEAVALEEVAREITSSLERDEVFQRIVDQVRELCRSDLAFLAPYDAETATAAIAAAAGAGSQALAPVAITPGHGAGGQVLETGEPFVTEEYDRDPRISRESVEIRSGAGVVALAVVPLRFRGKTTGLLWVANREPRAFTGRDLRVLTQLADQAAIALENSRLYANAQELGVNRERVRLAAELHDTLSQFLFSFGLKLDWCLHRLSGASELGSRIEEMKRDTGFMMGRLRDVIWRLTSDREGEGTVSEHLRRVVHQFQELTHLPVDLVEEGDVARLGWAEREPLVKTFREALANIAKHARATRATARIVVRPPDVLFEVADDGVGLPPGANVAGLAQEPGHFGLRQMLERIEALGGRLEFGRAVPSGFRLRGSLPLR
jgi:GAF domain-containing protein